MAAYFIIENQTLQFCDPVAWLFFGVLAVIIGAWPFFNRRNNCLAALAGLALLSHLVGIAELAAAVMTLCIAFFMASCQRTALHR